MVPWPPDCCYSPLTLPLSSSCAQDSPSSGSQGAAASRGCPLLPLSSSSPPFLEDTEFTPLQGVWWQERALLSVLSCPQCVLCNLALPEPLLSRGEREEVPPKGDYSTSRTQRLAYIPSKTEWEWFLNFQSRSWINACSSYYHRNIQSLGLELISEFSMFKKFSLGHTLRVHAILWIGGRCWEGKSHGSDFYN